ncbi:hypothetical protein BSU01_01020 [Erwinia billingiae]|uniref:hypothetical protein n=1 Tax=Erwinia billingiae TaxID=182337 RepID=UPI0019D21103|nr:hypothetical protein [Erwinia billingiae]MBN7120300.1 hypothetical protein [Erwinia billingiae]
MNELIRFIRDVSTHKVEVLREDGLYRHLRFARPKTNAYYFDIVTWPGYLVVTGDMGTWTFSRITDMFEFFTDKHFGRQDSFQINPGYWSEKFESGAGGGRYDTPCYEFDERAFEQRLKAWLVEYLADCEDDYDREQAEDAVDNLVREGFQNAWMAGQALNDADFPRDVNSWDILEGMGSLQTYSHHYLWICYAIVWGIERYSNQKLALNAMEKFFVWQLPKLDLSGEV